MSCDKRYQECSEVIRRRLWGIADTRALDKRALVLHLNVSFLGQRFGHEGSKSFDRALLTLAF